MLRIDVEPVAKARPRKGKGGRFYTPEKTQTYEDIIGWAYSNEVNRGRAMVFQDGEPVRAILGFFFSIPSSYSKKRKKSILDGSEDFTKRPDVDNLVKAVLDGLNGVAFRDDSQVVEVMAFKEYTDGDSYVTIQLEDAKGVIE